MDKQNRKKERLAAHLFAELTSSNSGKSLGRGIVVNVSLSGLGVETEADLSINDIISCHIEIPLKLDAKVVRIEGSGQLRKYGLLFRSQSLFDKIILKKLFSGSLKTRKLNK
ncbi:MAG: hypothetical protein KCHDKBKB_00534 [Elusimicrobia bacterium]|nr:hypothetical protein [Elusimicrobiota bacterium]